MAFNGANRRMAEMDVLAVLERLTRLAFDDTSGALVARGLIFHLACAAEGRPYQNPVGPAGSASPGRPLHRRRLGRDRVVHRAGADLAITDPSDGGS